MKLRVKFNKKNYLKYISHLDLIRLFQRSFNRAQIPVKYSEGFNPQPRFSIAHPLSLGIESCEEYMDIELEEKIDPLDFMESMNQILPKDIQILDCIYPKDKRPIAAIISLAHYEISFGLVEDMDMDEVKGQIDRWLEKEKIIITRIRKRRGRQIKREQNIRPLIKKLAFTNNKENGFTIETLFKVGDGGNLRPDDFIDALIRDNSNFKIDKEDIQVKRLGLYIEKGKRLEKPIW